MFYGVWSRSVPFKFQKYLKIFLELSDGQVRQSWHTTLVIPPRTSVATILAILCNHRDGEYFLHRITSKLGSTATQRVITRLLPLTDYVSGAENETQRDLLGHTNGNIEMRSPSATDMMTIVAAATNVRFPPVMEILIELIALCAGNRPVSGGCPAQRDNNADRLLCLRCWAGEPLNKQPSGRLNETSYARVTSP